VETDTAALRDFLTFQFTLGEKTLFKGITLLEPGQYLWATCRGVTKRRYWEVHYEPDFEHTGLHFDRQTRELVEASVALHLRADVPVGGYLSGGLDSSIVSSIASRNSPGFMAFTGAFKEFPGYDETPYARDVAAKCGFEMVCVDLTADDFLSSISDIVYHLDYPVAGPGAFPQYHVSKMAARHRKVVLGGQGGDEIFGGYARYLIGYFEQCIKAAIDGVGHNGNFVVTYESIIPNLVSLQQYKPLLREFFREGLFDDMDHRYFRLVDRSRDWDGEVDFESLGDYHPFETFQSVFHSRHVGKESYFDLMTHFDFKTLLPALLQVEDRVSMAHGLESRVPFLDHELVAKIATAPADIKFKNGELKRLLRESCGDLIPDSVRLRKDKMGFPVPLTEWLKGPLRDFAIDVFSVGKAKGRSHFRFDRILEGISTEAPFSRKIWGLLCLELWQQRFHDRAAEWRQMRAA
jgi:asparagine synthase (glutamine-hydrolysing)